MPASPHSSGTCPDARDVSSVLGHPVFLRHHPENVSQPHVACLVADSGRNVASNADCAGLLRLVTSSTRRRLFHRFGGDSLQQGIFFLRFEEVYGPFKDRRPEEPASAFADLSGRPYEGRGSLPCSCAYALRPLPRPAAGSLPHRGRIRPGVCTNGLRGDHYDVVCYRCWYASADNSFPGTAHNLPGSHSGMAQVIPRLKTPCLFRRKRARLDGISHGIREVPSSPFLSLLSTLPPLSLPLQADACRTTVPFSLARVALRFNTALLN